MNLLFDKSPQSALGGIVKGAADISLTTMTPTSGTFSGTSLGTMGGTSLGVFGEQALKNLADIEALTPSVYIDPRFSIGGTLSPTFFKPKVTGGLKDGGGLEVGQASMDINIFKKYTAITSGLGKKEKASQVLGLASGMDQLSKQMQGQAVISK